MTQFVLLLVLLSLSTILCQIIPISKQNDQNDMDSLMTLMEQSIAALQSQMTASNKELALLKTELTTVKTRLQTTESELKTVKAQLSSTTMSPDHNEYTQMKTDVALLRAQYTTLTSQLNATVMDTIGSDVSSNTKNIKFLNVSCNAVHNSIYNINALAQRNAGDVASLSSELTKVKSLDTDVNVTKTLCQKTVSDIKSLNSNISEISGKVSTIQNSLVNITGSRMHISYGVRQMKNNVIYGDNEILKFDDVTLNTGNAYNPVTGIFLAPVDGTYLFWANVLSRDNAYFDILLQREGQVIAEGYTGQSNRGTATITHVVHLMKGEDVVWLTNRQYGDQTRIYGGFSSYGGTLLHV